MTGGVGQALEQALAFWRAPALLGAARQRPLPDDVLEVVRIAAGDRAAAEFGAAALGATPAELAEAAPFYLQQLLFAPGADSYRVLGVNPDAPDARIKDHYRWLVRWLHPDRNADEWEALYADRVNRAWQDLRQPERRAAYDASLAGGVGDFAPEGAPSAAPLQNPPAGAPPGATLRAPIPAEEPLLSARTTQRLPILVLGGFGLLAGAVLGLMWYAQAPRGPRATPAPVAVVAEPELPAALAAANPEIPAAPPVGGPSGPTNRQPTPEPAAPPPPVMAAATPAPVPAPAPAPAQIAPEGAPTARAPRPVVATPPVGGPSGPTATPQPVGGPSGPTTRPQPKPVASPAPEQAPVRVAVAPEGAPTGRVPPPTPAPITEPEALAVLDAFTRAYSAGDLRALMRLFTRDATNNRGGRAAIAFDYQSLFDESEARELQLRPNGWLQGEGSATVLARFEASVQREGRSRAGRSVGDIRFDLAREDGVLRIRNIRHDER